MLKKNLEKIIDKFKKSKSVSPDFIVSDETFLEDIYQKLLGRETDKTGKAHYLKHLKEGYSRISVILDIIESEEFINKIIRENIPLPPIKNERPDSYQLSYDIYGREEIWVFKVKNLVDFDWLEKKIIENGYYERPGVWSLQISEDKRLLAEITSAFHPQSVLDIGCANGPVMKCLQDMGIDCDGVDISQMAIAKAFPEVKENIHLGDFLDINLPNQYDVILGLDIFEHLNPNKLKDYILKIYSMLNKGGYLYCNIPGFGHDSVFGEIFKLYIKEWEDDVQKERCFRTIHVDNYGYPKNGHIIGADSSWWVKKFENSGFTREMEIERALHKKYDDAMDRIHIARKAYYVFSKNSSYNKNSEIIKILET